MIYVGVDVGIKGAVSVIDINGKLLTTFKMPINKDFKFSNSGKKTSIVDISKLKSLLLPAVGSYKKDEVFIGMEKLFLAKMSKGNGMLTSGMNYGRMWAVLELITPNINIIAARTWQSTIFKKYGITPDGDSDSKSMSIELASRLYGEKTLITSGCKVASDGIADSLLIAQYLRMINSKG